MLFSHTHLRLLKRFLFLLIPYSLLRIGFYFYHIDIYKQFPQGDIFESFLLGLRFDIAALCLLNLPIILLSLIPSRNPQFLTFERILFVFLNFAGIMAALNDYELFLFTGKRLSFDFFVISKDILEQLPQITLYYWYMPVIGILWAVGYYYFDKKFFKPEGRPVDLPRHFISWFTLLSLSLIGVRGGLQHKSINVQTAFTQGRNELGHLVLNTPYHFLRTLKNKAIKKLEYFPSDEAAINVILNARDFKNGARGFEKMNVVLIILESFSLEYMEEGFTPFLSRMKKESTFFPYHLANGRRSVEALPSLLCGLPALLDEPISKSIFQGNKFTCMPKLLKQHGYTNYFFHGGSRGTMGFESYTLANGFDRYFSREDYPLKADYDGTWGIYDEPYLQFFASELDKMKEPFLGGIFTLSSHQPYSVPTQYKDKFPKGKLEIHESIGYADFALERFFETVAVSPWYKNTIFIITSDHTQKHATKKYQNMIGQYRVPLLIFIPGKKLKIDSSKVSQHSDIPRTVLDLVGIKNDHLPLTSVSWFSQDRGLALNYADGQEYFFATKNEVVTLSKNGEEKRFHYDWESGQFSAAENTEATLLKAYLQYFVNGLINNNLSLYR